MANFANPAVAAKEIANLIEVVETAAINPDISAEVMGALAHQQRSDLPGVVA